MVTNIFPEDFRGQPFLVFYYNLRSLVKKLSGWW